MRLDRLPPTPSKPKKRSPWLLVGIIGAALAVLIPTVFFLLSGDGGPEPIRTEQKAPELEEGIGLEGTPEEGRSFETRNVRTKFRKLDKPLPLPERDAGGVGPVRGF